MPSHLVSFNATCSTKRPGQAREWSQSYWSNSNCVDVSYPSPGLRQAISRRNHFHTRNNKIKCQISRLKLTRSRDLVLLLFTSFWVACCTSMLNGHRGELRILLPEVRLKSSRLCSLKVNSYFWGLCPLGLDSFLARQPVLVEIRMNQATRFCSIGGRRTKSHCCGSGSTARESQLRTLWN